MVMSGFSQLELEKRLSQLKDTAESVQSLSAWCIKYKHQHRRIVNSWLKIIKRAKVQQRLPLFYLANDVIQYSRRKSLDFVSSFQTVLEGAMPLVRDEKLRPAITRILKIWDDRAVYDSTYIATLSSVVSNVGKGDTKENAQILSDFRTSDLIQRLREMEETEKETDCGLKAINDGDFHVSDNAIEELRANVKSRSQSKLFVSELEAGVAAVERYVGALDREIQLRAELIEQLERGEIFYDTQRSDAKVVAVAYKNFSKRVREVRRRLEECLPKLPDVSPVPSPDVNAPSPTNSDDGLQLPDEAGEAEEPPPPVDPRSEIEKLLGSWTSGNHSSPQQPAEPPARENGADAGPASMPSFLLAGLTGGGSGDNSTDLFPGFEASPLTGDERDLFPGPEQKPPVEPPPPPPPEPQPHPAAFSTAQFSPPGGAEGVSAISVVTGVQQAQPATPLQDDYDDEYDAGPPGRDDSPDAQLSDFVRLMGQRLDRAPETPAPPPVSAPAPPAVQIPGLDLTTPPDLSRPPPAFPSLSQPPPRSFPTVPPPDPGLWSSRPPPPPAWKPADRARSWEEPAGDAPASPPQYEKGNDAYNADLDLPAAFKAVADLARLPFSADTDHRTLLSVPPPGPPPMPVPPPVLSAPALPPPLPLPPQPVPAPAPVADVDARVSSGDTDHRLWDRSVDAFISQVTEDRDYRRRSMPAADSDYRPPATDLAEADDHHAQDMDIDSGEEVRRASRDTATAALTEAAAPTPETSPAIELLTPPPVPSPELVHLEEEAVGEAAASDAAGAGDPSLSSWSSTESGEMEEDDEEEDDADLRRQRRSKKKRRRRESGGRKHKKERRHSHSSGRKRDRRTSGDGDRRRHRTDSEDRDERRRRDKHDSRSKRRRSSRDESVDRGKKERDSERERERSRGRDRSRDRHRDKGRARDDERVRSRDRDRSPDRDREKRRSRERDKERSRYRDRDRSPARRGEGGGGGGGFDYSVVGAGAHRSPRAGQRDRGSRRWDMVLSFD